MKQNVTVKPEYHNGNDWQTIASESWTNNLLINQLKEVQDGRVFDILLLLDEVL
jgi:hypothetical protein